MLRDEVTCEEHKIDFDGSTKAKAQLVKEIVAMANAAGGRILVGVDPEGHVVGVDRSCVVRLDPSRVGDYVSSFVGDQPVLVEVRRQVHGDLERLVVCIEVAACAEPPIVMERDGTYSVDGRQEMAFPAGAVIVRDSTSARPARRADYRRWIAAAHRRGEQSAFDMMRQLADRPEGTVVEFVVPKTPAARLRDAARAHAADPRKLLGSTELLTAAANTDELDLGDGDVDELVVQSALRKRTTLWWWVAELSPEPRWLADQLRNASEATDRDVSDAGLPILRVAALACPEAFDELRERLAASTKYAHFREAAEACPDAATTLEHLQLRATTSRVTRSECLDLVRDAQGAGSARGASVKLERPLLRLALAALDRE